MVIILLLKAKVKVQRQLAQTQLAVGSPQGSNELAQVDIDTSENVAYVTSVFKR